MLTTSDSIYSFDPGAMKFEFIGALSCGTAARPNSMAVDRSGIAWVNYTDGSLFKVNTRNAACESTPFRSGQPGFNKFGMAFASDAAGSREETLYVVSLSGEGFAKIDRTTFELVRLGDFSGDLAKKGAELTGTGEGKLFGFVSTDPAATLAQIDKATGATSEARPLTSVNTGLDYAFSFWGGDFWFYTAGDGSGSATSRVTQYKLSTTRQLTVVNPSVGFRIVGAGVSTCAPVVPPK